MASTSNPYTYQNAATTATRSLVTGNKPTEASLPSSTDADPHAKPMLQRKPTDNYEKAAAAATRSDRTAATTAGSVAASVTDRPGAQRQQSWKMSDLKGHQQGQMLAGVPGGQGYSSTQT